MKTMSVLAVFEVVLKSLNGADSVTNKKEMRSEEHTSELQSRPHLVCRLLLEKKKQKNRSSFISLVTNLISDGYLRPRRAAPLQALPPRFSLRDSHVGHHIRECKTTNEVATL